MIPRPVSILPRFDQTRPVIGMIHTGPLPGMPDAPPIEVLVARAREEATILIENGIDGLLVENMFDFPCIHEREMGPEVASAMTRICSAVKEVAGKLPVGVQVLFQANATALAVAIASGCEFVRAEGWTHAHISDKGIAEASAGKTIRYRHAIGADHIAILADVKKKHASHAWTNDLSAAEIAAGMNLHRADGVIVTGSSTGTAPDVLQVQSIRNASGIPLFIGSGITSSNISSYFPYVDGFIVGSSLKISGRWNGEVSGKQVADLMKAVNVLRTRNNPR